jgi:hypothetical protein
MTEDFLQYVWKYKLFNLQSLITTSNNTLEIISVGSHNTESGPDFFNAKIKVDEITWVGQVEIHINSSDWYKHKHHKDPVYLKTILHVVLNFDEEVFDYANNPIPTLCLNGRVSKQLISNFHHLKISKHQLLCQGMTKSLDEFLTNQWLERLLINRLENKVKELAIIHSKTKSDWAQTFFIQLAKNFGFKSNSVPMQLLAEGIGFKILLKHKDSLLVLEAILLGYAGLLEDVQENKYTNELIREYMHQQNKYEFEGLEKSIWKFGRIRPSNFPTLRLAQMAKLIHSFGNLFDVLVRDFNMEFNNKALNLQASAFWDTHYTLKKESHNSRKSLGVSSVNNILINTVAPMLFFYGKSIGSSVHKELAIELLDSLPVENNSIIKKWRDNNIISKRASQGQALIELTNYYCKPKKCLTCGIAKQILSK